MGGPPLAAFTQVSWSLSKIPTCLRHGGKSLCTSGFRNVCEQDRRNLRAGKQHVGNLGASRKTAGRKQDKLILTRVSWELRAFYFGDAVDGTETDERHGRAEIVQDTCSGAVSIDLGSQMVAKGVPSRRARPSAKAFWAPESGGQLGPVSREAGKACEFSYARA